MTDEIHKYIDVIKKEQGFINLSNNEVKDILKMGKLRKFKRGEVVFKEGETGDEFFIILKGSIRISTNVPGIGEEALAVLKSGEFFGEMALIDNTVRSATAVSNEETELFSINRINFNNLIQETNPFAYKIIWGLVKKLSARLRETDERLKAILALIKSF